MVLRTHTIAGGLNAHVPWEKVTELLELPTLAQSLPATISCPLCLGDRLHLYEDSISGGAWYYCADCKQAGDMIELAAAAWEISTTSAIRKLAKYGIEFPKGALEPEYIVKHLAAHQEYRHRIQEMWHKAQKYMSRQRSPEVARLRTLFRLHAPGSPDHWETGPGNLIGALPRMDVERAFCPGSPRATSESRLFKGAGWGDVLVIPYQNTPGRICAFMFVGRRASPHDFIFRVAGSPPKPHTTKLEAGLAGLWSVQNSGGMFDKHIFVVDDPFLACRLQVRQFMGSQPPLPLVAFYDGLRYATGLTSWQCLKPYTPVFFGWKLTAKLLHQAMITDGMISIARLHDTKPETINSYYSDNRPMDLFRKALRFALPWREALQKWASLQQYGTVEDLLIRIEPYGHPASSLDFLGDVVHQVFKPKRNDPPHTANSDFVELGGDTYYQRRKCGTKLLVLNALLRVDATYTEWDAVRYRGRLLCHGKTVKFDVKDDNPGQRPWEKLRVIATRERVSLFIMSTYSNRIWDAALQFSPPKVLPPVV